jgi:hypothetical protein
MNRRSAAADIFVLLRLCVKKEKADRDKSDPYATLREIINLRMEACFGAVFILDFTRQAKDAECPTDLLWAIRACRPTRRGGN